MELLNALLPIIIILTFIYLMNNASKKRIDNIRKEEAERAEKMLNVLKEIRDLLKK